MLPLCILAIENDSDREFMTQIYEQYHRLMYSEIYAITRDVWATEDIMHATVERLIEKIELMRSFDRNRLVNYIISASKNNSYNYLNYERRRSGYCFDEFRDSAYAEDDISRVEDRIDLSGDLRMLAEVWKELDDYTRYLLEARYILNKSYETMAKELGVRADSLRMALTRARKKALRLMMDKAAEKQQNRSGK